MFKRLNTCYLERDVFYYYQCYCFYCWFFVFWVEGGSFNQSHQHWPTCVCKCTTYIYKKYIYFNMYAHTLVRLFTSFVLFAYSLNACMKFVKSTE